MKETTKNMKKLLIALLMMPMCMAAQTKLTDYQFAYFNNNATEGQQVCYAVSNDSMNFTPLNDGQPVTICQPELRDRLWQSFLTPPDSIRVGCYYYWVNEHVDPEGVRKDLEWMKQNGITLAFLATDIRNRTRWERPWEGETFGKNKFRSRLWWKNLRTALKTAGELGIEMGIFNCPGWSQSGGPWVKPHEAMRNWTSQGIQICQTKQGTDVMCGPCSDEAEGLEVDKLSKRHVQKHFEAFIGDILRRIPAALWLSAQL